jgi:hypothetical protein
MALVPKPNKVEVIPFDFNPGYNTKVHILTQRYATVPKRQEPSPIRSEKGTSVLLYRGPKRNPSLPPSVYVVGVENNDAWRAVMQENQILDPTIAMVQNKAYERFKNALGDTAELGQSLAERKQAVNMIVDRLTALRLGYLDLRKGRFDDFLRRFRLRETGRVKRRSRWTRPRDASNLWLEYHFGWSPLLSDIYNGIRIIESPFEQPRTIRGTDTRPFEMEAPKSDFIPHFSVGKVRVSMRLQADYVISNPNLYRATQLGLTNPIATAWELVPFSFLVDWFIPIGNFLNSYSDFYGVTFSNAFTTRYFSFRGKSYGYYHRNPDFQTDDTVIVYNEAMKFRRTLGLVTPVVYPKIFQGFSVTRAATSIALLLAVFKP